MHSALIAVADGSEDIETVATADVLHRAGFTTTIASVGTSDSVTLMHGSRLQCNGKIDAFSSNVYDVIVCPGGGGCKSLASSTTLITMLKAQVAANRWIAAICAAPAVVLAAQKVVANVPMVCYPMKDLEATIGASLDKSGKRVLCSGKVITSVGPDSAIEFGLEIVKQVASKVKALDVARQVLSSYAL